MKLYGSHRSPYVQKVRTFIRVKGIACEFIDVRTSAPEVVALNPLSQIPTLACDDGSGLFDSCVIVEYIEMLHKEPPLIPADPRERIAVRRWEALSDGMAEAARMIAHEMHEAPDTRKGPDYFRKHLSKVERGFAYVDATLDEGGFLAGPQMTLADVAFAAAYAYVMHSPIDPSLAAAAPKAAAHAHRLFEHPAFAPLTHTPGGSSS